MPEKAGNRAKNDISSPAPAAAGQAELEARPCQKKAPGLHKRVLSAVHSLARGTRSSKSASGGSIRRKTFTPADRPTSSAPARKPGKQHRALQPQPCSYTKARRTTSAVTNPLGNVKTHVVEDVNYHQDTNALPCDEHVPDFGFQKEASLFEIIDRADQQPQKVSSGFVDEAYEEEEEEEDNTPQKSSIMDELNIEKQLREADPDRYHAILKASLRNVAGHCNNLELGENQANTHDWENVAQLLPLKLLGNNLNSNLNPHLPLAAARQHPAEQTRKQERDEKTLHVSSSPFSPSLSLPPSNESYRLLEENQFQHLNPQQQAQRFHWEGKAAADPHMHFSHMDVPLFNEKGSEQEHIAHYRRRGTRGNGSDGSSPLLSFNSTDFDL